MLWPTKPRTTVCAVDRVLQLQSRVRRLSDDVSVRNDAAPVMAQFAGFSCSLSGETLIAEPSSDYASVDAARAALEPALHAWEASSELNQGLRFSFKYTGCAVHDVASSQQRPVAINDRHFVGRAAGGVGADRRQLGGSFAAWREDHPRGRRLRVCGRQRRLREHMDRHGQFRRLLRLSDPLHRRARTLDGLVDCGCRSRPGGCQVRMDGRVLGRWLRTVLAVDHRGLYPTDRAARPVEQRRTLRPDRWSNAAR